MTPGAERKIDASNEAIMRELLWLRSKIEPLLPLVEKYTGNPAARWRSAVPKKQRREVQESQRTDVHREAG